MKRYAGRRLSFREDVSKGRKWDKYFFRETIARIEKTTDRRKYVYK